MIGVAGQWWIGCEMTRINFLWSWLKYEDNIWDYVPWAIKWQIQWLKYEIVRHWYRPVSKSLAMWLKALFVWPVVLLAAGHTLLWQVDSTCEVAVCGNNPRLCWLPRLSRYYLCHGWASAREEGHSYAVKWPWICSILQDYGVENDPVSRCTVKCFMGF